MSEKRTLILKPTGFNPAILIAQETRIMEIDDSNVYVDMTVYWDDNDIWKLIFHVRRWTHSCISSMVYDLGTYASLKEAVDRACSESGIKANDPQYKQKVAEKRKLESTLRNLESIKDELGESAEIETLMKACKDQLAECSRIAALRNR